MRSFRGAPLVALVIDALPPVPVRSCASQTPQARLLELRTNGGNILGAEHRPRRQEPRELTLQVGESGERLRRRRAITPFDDRVERGELAVERGEGRRCAATASASSTAATTLERADFRVEPSDRVDDGRATALARRPQLGAQHMELSDRLAVLAQEIDDALRGRELLTQIGGWCLDARVHPHG